MKNSLFVNGLCSIIIAGVFATSANAAGFGGPSRSNTRADVQNQFFVWTDEDGEMQSSCFVTTEYPVMITAGAHPAATLNLNPGDVLRGKLLISTWYGSEGQGSQVMVTVDGKAENRWLGWFSIQLSAGHCGDYGSALVLGANALLAQRNAGITLQPL